nr:actin cytoskeleton-regulatory complex protein PAN1-like [Penaeus vannamei]
MVDKKGTKGEKGITRTSGNTEPFGIQPERKELIDARYRGAACRTRGAAFLPELFRKGSKVDGRSSLVSCDQRTGERSKITGRKKIGAHGKPCIVSKCTSHLDANFEAKSRPPPPEDEVVHMAENLHTREVRLKNIVATSLPHNPPASLRPGTAAPPLPASRQRWFSASVSAAPPSVSAAPRLRQRWSPPPSAPLPASVSSAPAPPFSRSLPPSARLPASVSAAPASVSAAPRLRQRRSPPPSAPLPASGSARLRRGEERAEVSLIVGSS